MNDNRGARLHVECVDGGRGRFRLDRPENDASEIAGELVLVVPVWARGRDVGRFGRTRFKIGGLARDEVFDVTLLVRCREEYVDPKSVEDELVPEPDIGPETDRPEEAIDNRLELRGVPVPTDGPDAARRALGFGGGGVRNFPGDAESLEKLPFLSRLCRGRGTSRLARTRGLSLRCEELWMTDTRLLRPELMTLEGRDFCPLIRSNAIASSSVQV